MFGDATSVPDKIPPNPSSSSVTPNAWNDFPAFKILKMIQSPTFALIVGLFSGSPGNALKANVLKSFDSIKSNVIGMSAPVCATAGAAASSPVIPAKVCPAGESSEIH